MRTNRVDEGISRSLSLSFSVSRGTEAHEERPERSSREHSSRQPSDARLTPLIVFPGGRGRAAAHRKCSGLEGVARSREFFLLIANFLRGVFSPLLPVGDSGRSRRNYRRRAPVTPVDPAAGAPGRRTVANRRRGRRSPERLLILRSVARDEGERIIAARGSGLPAELARRERRLLAPGRREFDDFAVEATVAAVAAAVPFFQRPAPENTPRGPPARSADPRGEVRSPPGHTSPPRSLSLDDRGSVLSYPPGHAPKNTHLLASR